MKIKLYDKFNHWHKDGVIWVISDLHFCDEDCLLMNKKWPTPMEQVELINSKVGKKDTLICLGDVGNEEWVKELKGYKVLLLGNHDKGVSNYIKKYVVKHTRNGIVTEFPVKNLEDAKYTAEEVRFDYIDGNVSIKDNGLFDEVYEGPLFINEKILLSHEPVDLPFGINIHGHVHNGQHIVKKENSVMINMAADVIKFEPIRLDKLVEGHKVETIHRITIDRASANPLHKK